MGAPVDFMAGLLGAHKHPQWDEFGAFSWTLIGLAALVVLWVIWRAVHYTLTPGETDPEHIKRSILRDEQSPDVPLSSGEAPTHEG